ncbi:MAG TPA: Ig-like domain-containing protein, partial [Gemmatimonadales bacterium]|nr:Ig-like domain-containing protein [Gemmatimonadales bacterium]
MTYRSIPRPRRLALLLSGLASACGGEDLVLPEEGVPTSIVVVSGNAQNGTVNTALPAGIVVRVLDVQSRPVPGQEVRFSPVTGGGSAAPATTTTNAEGQATTAWTLGAAAGVQQLEARAVGGGAPSNLAIVLTATASASAAAAIEAVSGDAQTATAGSTLDDSLIVRVTDAADNPVAGVNVAWSVTGGGTVSEATTTTGADGRTGVRRTLGTTAGAQTTIATVAGLTGSPVTFTATATVGSAGKLDVTTQPSATASSGAPFAQQPRVQIEDANGNPVSAAGRAITAEIASGPGGATLIGVPTVATNSSGLAIFTNLGITGPAGSYTLNFTGVDLTGTTSAPVTLTAGAASRLAFTVQPSNATAGAAIAPAVRVTVQDALGQTVTGATNAITVSIGSNPGGGTLSGTTTVNAVSGVATFSTLAINRSGSNYTLNASAAGLTGTTSATFDILTGPPAAMAASVTIPATTTAATTVAPDAAVRVTDASGNPVPGVSVTFAAVNGGSVSGESQTTSAQGIAT